MKKQTINICFVLLYFLPFIKYSHSSKLLTDDSGDKKTISVSEPKFSLDSGFYNSEVISELTITSNETKIYYTVDSTNPSISETAKIYTKPIKMFDRSSEPNIYSKYQHEEDSPYSIILKTEFRANNDLFDKITIIRAVSQNEKGEFSKVITKSYFIMNQEKLEFYKEIPSISLVTSPDNLFDKNNGIYVCGQQYLDWKNSSDYNPDKSEWDLDNTANFFSKGKDWEREALITYFDKGGKVGFEQNFGIKIKGASSRNQKNKSFNVYARSKFGESKLQYKLLENNKNYLTNKIINKYDSFALRSIEWVHRLRESIIQSALKDIPSLATYDTKRCTLFLDGEFWGLYEIMERCSGYYIQSNYGIPSDNIYAYKNYLIEEGPKEIIESEIWELHNFCQKNNLANVENYEFISSKIDVESIIYHYAVGLYIGIWDWPNYNYFMWRNNGEKIDGNEYSDGKWRFGSFDFDFSAGVTYESYGNVEGYQFDYFEKLNYTKDHYAPTSLFLGMLHNNEFKKKFIQVFERMADDIFEGKKMKKIIDEMEEKYMKFMILNEWRWKNNNSNDTFDGFSSWEGPYLSSELDVMRIFFENRAEHAFEQMANFLSHFS